ncbi:hypothetical protein LPJ70_001145 [Coemansia sp. RSA 2708]|nr:hypothetical protein LPJ70_001145 [Coemansia sp. RSA 2708]KAJ2363445.1 hypothetical protein H4S01_004298 [Coemansia sp. RSA 2610]
MAKPKVFVIYYSTYGHVHTLAQSISKGVLKSGDVDVEIYQFPETLSDDALEKMHAAPKANIPTIDVDKLTEADGVLIGFPTRFGTAPAQVKTFFDATGHLWSTGALLGKCAGLFFSTGAQHGGQESTAYSFLPHLTHHGIIYVPLGYPSPYMFENDAIVGGSAWGAGVIAGPDGSLQPTYKELEIAEIQGEKFAEVVRKMHATPDSTAAAAAGGKTAETAAAPAAPAEKQPAAASAPADAAAGNAPTANPPAQAPKKDNPIRRLLNKFKKAF